MQVELPVECDKTDLDSYKAVPVLPGSIRHARQFLSILPNTIPIPSSGEEEPNGHVTLEWYRSSSQVLSVSIDENANLSYAALVNGTTAHGSLPLTGKFPNLFRKLIRAIYH